MKSIGLCVFGLSPKDIAVFERVIEFFAKKGKKFHQCSAELAAIFLVNDEPEAIKLAQEQRQYQVIVSVSDSNYCEAGDFKIKRPLLITKVMRVLDQSREQWQTSNKSDAYYEEKVITPAVTQEKGDFHALVVDDSAAIRKQLELELRDTAISADYAVCGHDALEKINKNQYDIIFLDIIMPDIYGYEVCKQLRKKPNYKRTPVIMLSGKTEPLDEVEGILAGATTYLLKPVKHTDFQNTLTRISKWLHDYA